MLKNYFRTAWRNMLKNRLTTFINIFGLAIGISCSLLIWLWVRDERSYNQFIPDADRVYQVLVNVPFNGDTITQDAGPGPLQPTIQNTVPEAEAVTKIGYSPDLLFTVGNKSIKEKGNYVTDDFFRVFQLRALDGSPDRAIRNIDQVVITRKIAERYFHTVVVAGKRIKIDNSKEYVIGAVIEDLPHNSTLQFDWLINFKVNEQDWMKTWGNVSFPTYLKLKPNTSARAAASAMRSIYPSNAPEGFKYNYPILQPIKNIYLYSKYENGKSVGGRIEYVTIFGLVAIFILLIACINFMNLATARSSLRAKEIGVRKVSGASRGSLIKQFITESVLICLFATGIAVFMVWTFLPVFNTLFDKQIHLAASAPSLWIAVIVLVIATAIITGSYPALLLSSFKPVKILKGDSVAAGANTNTVRKALVVFQFALSSFLIVGMVVVSKQMHFIQTKNLGFDKEHLMYIHLDGELSKRVESYQNELNKLSGVVASCPINSLPMDLRSNSSDLSWEGKPENFQSNTTATWVGYGFAKSMGVTLTDGRDFSKSYAGDSANYVINESAARMMNMKNPVGQPVSFWNGKGTIIGVLQDFHMASIHSAINPLILALAPTNTEYMMIRLQTGNIQQTIARVGMLTRSFNPEYPYEYHFADETYETMYKNEMQVDALVKYFGVLAVIISCLGLFGMVTFSAERRYKEIGIRKVLGASIGSIVGLLSAQSLKMIAIAMVVAFPLAYWVAADWLATFHYKIDLDMGIFSLSAILLLAVSLITISFQSVKAALANPVDSLHTE